MCTSLKLHLEKVDTMKSDEQRIHLGLLQGTSGDRKKLRRKKQWLRTKTGKVGIGIAIVIILVVMALMILASDEGRVFKMSDGFTIKGGVLTINGGNYLKGIFQISGYWFVKSIVVKKDSLKNLDHLKITKCSKLEKIIVEDGYLEDPSSNTYYAPFENVMNVELTSIYADTLSIISSKT